MIVLLATCLLFPPAQQASRAASDGMITLERLFSSGDFRADHVEKLHWLDGGGGYVTEEPSETARNAVDLMLVDPSTGKKSIFVSAKQLTPEGSNRPLAVDSFEVSSDGKRVLVYTQSRKVWRENTRGDYWVLDRSSAKKIRQIGGKAAPSSLQFAKLSPDGTRVGYVRGNNLYVEEIATGQIKALTQDGSKEKINGTFDWVYEEELSLRDGWRWSPDGKTIVYWQLDTKGVKLYTLINDTAATYPTTKQFAWPMAGETNSAARVGAVPAEGGPTCWFELPADPRNHYPAYVEFADSSSEVIIQYLNRLQNQNSVYLADVKTGKVKEILQERDKCWVDIQENAVHWLQGGKSLTWISERDGWRHLYIIPRDGGDLRPVTQGSFDLIKLEHVDEKAGWAYFIASPENPTQRYLYRAKLDGTGKAERVTPANLSGTNDYDFSPDGKWAVHAHSSFKSPPRSELIRLPEHKATATLADSPELRKRIAGLKEANVEFFRASNGKGTELDCWIMKPPDFDPNKKYPLFFHVYGEPWDSTVRDQWQGSQGMWHWMLAQQGYLVASIDPQGAASPRGHAWRKSIYRKLGVLPAEDIAGAAKQIASRPYVDSKRVGIWGWSGGGTNSLNAILRYPDQFQTAIAVAAESDLRLYDTIYQERYMGLPQDNAEDYRKSSVVHLAGRLRGNLLIVHGTGDDNVHYQHAELLINALIAANKPFTMMAYPNRTHAINEGKGTTRHLYELLTRFLKENLPPGPRNG